MMMINNKYSGLDLISRMKSLPSFIKVPKNYHVMVIRSIKDQTDVFDDYLILFKSDKPVMWMPCTSNTGKWGLYNFWRYNKKGVAVIKSNEIYYNTFQKSDGLEIRHHNNKVQCLRLISNLLYFRDGNKNDKTEEIGKIYKGNFSTNIHPNSHTRKKGILSWIIGKWSLGCIVVNDLTKYWEMLKLIPLNQKITLTVLKEF